MPDDPDELQACDGAKEPVADCGVCAAAGECVSSGQDDGHDHADDSWGEEWTEQQYREPLVKAGFRLERVVGRTLRLVWWRLIWLDDGRYVAKEQETSSHHRSVDSCGGWLVYFGGPILSPGTSGSAR